MSEEILRYFIIASFILILNHQKSSRYRNRSESSVFKITKENIQKAKTKTTSLVICIIKSNLARVKIGRKTSGEVETACINSVWTIEEIYKDAISNNILKTVYMVSDVGHQSSTLRIEAIL